MKRPIVQCKLCISQTVSPESITERKTEEKKRKHTQTKQVTFAVAVFHLSQILFLNINKIPFFIVCNNFWQQLYT